MKKMLNLLIVLLLMCIPAFAETAADTELPPCYEADIYKVGTDIPAGRYMVFAEYVDSGYFAVTSDARGDDILFNDFGFTMCYVEVLDGEFFELDGALAYAYEEEFCKFMLEGMYALYPECNATFIGGIDLPVGEYKITKNNEDRNGYWAIIDWRHDLLSNDLFEKSSYVTVEEGDLLQLDGAHIVE